jgi:hypothetical protein
MTLLCSATIQYDTIHGGYVFLLPGMCAQLTAIYLSPGSGLCTAWIIACITGKGGTVRVVISTSGHIGASSVKYTVASVLAALGHW